MENSSGGNPGRSCQAQSAHEELSRKTRLGFSSALAATRGPKAAARSVFDGSGAIDIDAGDFCGIKAARRGSTAGAVATTSVGTKNHSGATRAGAPGRFASG